MILIRKSSSILHRCLGACSKNSIVLPPSLSLFTSKALDPSPQNPFIVKYLIDSVGLSSAEAIRASKFLPNIKSPLKPDSVLEFFRKNGFTDTDIRRIIFCHSRVLRAKVDSTLKPKFEALKELGFSEAQIIKLVTTSPSTLTYLSYCNMHPRIEFLNAFLGSNDDIVRAIICDICLLASSLDKTIKPNIAFLRECQISNERIGSLLMNGPRVTGRTLNFLKSIAKRVDELGVPCESGMFYYAFRCFCRFNSDMVDAKMKLLSSLGFSTSDVLSAILKQPSILNLSEKNLCETVDFLVKEVGCKLSYVSRYPSMLGLSLSKRLIPRNYVAQLLMNKGFLKRERGFYQIASISERNFLEKFILSFQKRMPELLDVYLSASAELLVGHHSPPREHRRALS